MKGSIRVLYVINIKLPSSDYRISYGKGSKIVKIIYGMPGITEGLPKSDYVYMGFREGWRYSYLLDFIRLYYYLITHRHELDLVHFYTTNLILFGPIIAHFARVKSVVTLTGFGRVFTNDKLINKLLRPIYKFFLGNSIHLSQLYLFQNHADLKLLSSKYPKHKNKFVFIGSSVDFPQVAQKDFNGLPLKVISVARLMPDKGIYDFIKVAEELNNHMWEFKLIGPASNGFNDLYQKVIDCNDRGIISYMGECSIDEIKIELEQSHIFLFLSNYGEGLSRTMLEAGFSFLCPIAYDIPANRDLITKGQGFILPIGDVKNVISTLNRLSGDRKALLENAQLFKNFIVKNYNIKTYTERLDNLMQEYFVKNGI